MFNGTYPLQQHHRQANALYDGLYTIRVRMLGKCSRARLRKVFTGPNDRKLDYRNLGTPVLVQINTEENCVMETAAESQE
jgi:hypothetical protein